MSVHPRLPLTRSCQNALAAGRCLQPSMHDFLGEIPRVVMLAQEANLIQGSRGDSWQVQRPCVACRENDPALRVWLSRPLLKREVPMRGSRFFLFPVLVIFVTIIIIIRVQFPNSVTQRKAPCAFLTAQQ